MFLANNSFGYATRCRTCSETLTEYSTGINLGENVNILKLLEYCIGLAVNMKCAEKKICTKCVENIEKFAKFKTKCLEYEELWQKSTDSKCLVEKVEGNLPIKEENIENCTDFNDTQFSEEYTGEFLDDFDKNKAFEDSNKVKEDNSLLANNGKLKIELNHYKKFVNPVNGQKVYHCKNCNKTYNKYKCLLTHIEKGCRKQNTKKFRRERNVKAETTDSESIKLSSNECGLCNISFICDLNEHLNQHWLNNDLKCELCNFIGSDFAHMITHRRIHFPKMKLECHACSKSKLSLLSLQFHFRSVHLQKPGGYCTTCDRTFTKYKTWKRHHRLHTEKDLFICDHCGRKFLFRHEIKSHLIDHSDVRQFVCETCGKGFKRISTLREHIENLHRTQKPVKCNHCNKTYKCENKLKIHMRNVAKDKPFACEVCAKKFHSETVLKKHLFWHTGQRPHACSLCGAAYKAKGQLAVHMRGHAGVRPYECARCGKSFTTGGGLRRHGSVHGAARRHACTRCDRTFHERRALVEHTAQHENDDVKVEK